MIPYSLISDDHYLNSIIDYYIIGVLFMGIVFIKGYDSLEYFRLPSLKLSSIITMLMVASFAWAEMIDGLDIPPTENAIIGVIYLFGIGFGEEMASRRVSYGVLRKYGR